MIAIEIIQMLRNSEMDKIDEKVVIQEDEIQFIGGKSKGGQKKNNSVEYCNYCNNYYQSHHNGGSNN